MNVVDNLNVLIVLDWIIEHENDCRLILLLIDLAQNMVNMSKVYETLD